MHECLCIIKKCIMVYEDLTVINCELCLCGLYAHGSAAVAGWVIMVFYVLLFLEV